MKKSDDHFRKTDKPIQSFFFFAYTTIDKVSCFTVYMLDTLRRRHCLTLGQRVHSNTGQPSRSDPFPLLKNICLSQNWEAWGNQKQISLWNENLCEKICFWCSWQGRYPPCIHVGYIIFEKLVYLYFQKKLYLISLKNVCGVTNSCFFLHLEYVWVYTFNHVFQNVFNVFIFIRLFLFYKHHTFFNSKISLHFWGVTTHFTTSNVLS